MAGTFAGFESYRLNGVRLTEDEFGRGSYAVVLRVQYRGLKCAGKQLYPVLYEQGVGDTVRRFEEECRLLAQMRHPNIVQFIGVYFEEDCRVPILVMEFLPTTLATCIDTYGVLPEDVSYAILHDVALGLYHLHSQTPPIVHRDLSANNVLLASNMTAKISDLGVARILNLTPQQMSRMTRTPGTPSYMPPEAMRANPRYDATIDEFSYGILMIHVLSGRWPLPLREPVCVNPENCAQLLPVSEAERRDEYLRDIGHAHPLMDLILRCVSNDPEQRATAAEMVQQMEHVIRDFPPAFPNRVEMLQRIRADATEKGSLREEIETFAAEYEQSRVEREELIQQHQADVEQVRTEVTAEVNAQNTAAQTQLRGEIQRLEQLAQHRQEEIERSELAHSIEIEQTCLQLAGLQIHTETLQARLRSENETLQIEMISQNETFEATLSAQNEAREQERQTLMSERDSLRTERARMKRANFDLQAAVASKEKAIQLKDREIVSDKAVIAAREKEIAEAAIEYRELQAVVLSKDKEIESKQQEALINKEKVSTKNELIAAMSVEASAKEAAIVAKDAALAQKESELVSRNAILEHQSSAIRGLNKQLTRAREYLSGRMPQPHPLNPQAKITWEPCRDLPVGMSAAQTVVIGDRVYCGGGIAAGDDDHRVFSYSPLEDTWSSLPSSDVRYFGLGQVRGKLVTVGGRKKYNSIVTSKVYELANDESWKQSIPPMPVACESPAVLYYQSTLIAAGGYNGHARTSVVQVFREETSQWYTTEPLPFLWDYPSSLVIGNRWYLLGGGVQKEDYSNRVICANVDLLLQKAVPYCDQALTDRDSTNSAWEILPNTPHYGPAAATLAASLLAVGGATTNKRPTTTHTAVYVYSPCTNVWIHISDLPAPWLWAAAAMLSPTELLVIGGRGHGRHQSSVYKVLLQIE